MKREIRLLLFVIVSFGAITIALRASEDPSTTFTVRALALPDHGKGNITMDYIAYDPATGFVWAPAINIGAVYVVDTNNGSVREIPNFATNEVEYGGRKRTQGPSGVSVGDGVVYIGNRADSSICAIDAKTLARKTCGHIDSTPDGVVYVAPTKEVWVTAPRDKSVRILDSQTLAQKEKLTFEGQPEGYAVDAKRGRFYMNYEDKDLTTAIDLKSRKTVAKWPAGCGEDGPHGISLDQDSGFLFVACSTRAEVLDVGGHGGKLSSIDTGDGVDDLAFSPATRMLYVGAAKDARLTVARVDAAGKLTQAAQVPTREGARNGVVTKQGDVYLAHSQRGQFAGLVVVSPSGK
jgi:DNA-binding beta-propeller fold protein YncE